MTEDPSWAVQTAIFDRLTAFMEDGMEIIDNIEASEFTDTLPFILIGDDALIDNENQLSDDYTIRAFIRCHAAGPARKAVKLLAHQVRQAMAADLENDKGDIEVEGFQSTSRHAGTQTSLVEGIAHVAVVEWAFELLENTTD